MDTNEVRKFLSARRRIIRSVAETACIVTAAGMLATPNMLNAESLTAALTSWHTDYPSHARSEEPSADPATRAMRMPAPEEPNALPPPAEPAQDVVALAPANDDESLEAPADTSAIRAASVDPSVTPETASTPIDVQPRLELPELPADQPMGDIAAPSVEPIEAPRTIEVPVEKALDLKPIETPKPVEVSKPIEVQKPAEAPKAVEPPKPVYPQTVMVPMPLPKPPPTPAQELGLEGKERVKAEKCLAQAVYFEARNEPERGQVAVAQVVLNRVFSPYYPSDVCSVVYQNAHRHLSCQFTFACDGKPEAIRERSAWARATRIAKQTLDAKVWLPEVAKSTHYHASYVRPHWVREMKKMVKHGVHTFYRPRRWGDGSDEPGWGRIASAPTKVR
jgi:hypothetical protein